MSNDRLARETDHVGPIVFANETARRQLLENGEVVTFRHRDRTTGETWARASRTGPKIADVRVQKIQAVDTVDDEALLRGYAPKSGFDDVWAWKRAIQDVHDGRRVGVLYYVELIEITPAGQDRIGEKLAADGGDE